MGLGVKPPDEDEEDTVQSFVSLLREKYRTPCRAARCRTLAELEKVLDQLDLDFAADRK